MYIIDPHTDPDVELFVDAIATFEDLHRFWIDVEISTGGFLLADGSDAGTVDAEDVMPLSLIVLQKCVDAYVDGFARQTRVAPQTACELDAVGRY